MGNLGFLRVMAVSTEVEPGNIDLCLENAKKAVDKAVSESVSLLLLQELCLTSVSCGDLFLNSGFIDKAETAAADLTEYTRGKDIVVCFSFPICWKGRVYCISALAVDGKMIGAVPLYTNTGSCGLFSSFDGYETETINVCGEEIPFGKDIVFECMRNRLLRLRISYDCAMTACTDASVMLCPTAKLVTMGSENSIRNAVRSRSANDNCAIVYCSAGAGESTSSGVYSGQTMVIEDGTILSESGQFGEGISVADIDLESIEYRVKRSEHAVGNAFGRRIGFDLNERENNSIRRIIERYPFISTEEPERWRTAMEIQSHGLAVRLKKTNIDRPVIGVSGGLDSTLALLAAVGAVKLLGKTEKSVIAVSMPCFGTSVRTKTNADRLCEALGVDYRIIDISDSVSQHLNDIGHDMETTDTAYENAQARERTQVLMDLANMENGLVIGTGDMSESALGWCTFNGDHMSMYNVNCSITKTFIRYIVSSFANECEGELADVLRDIVDTPVSPELKPAVEGEISQKTEDIVGPYDVHDFILYHFIRNGSSPEKILRLAETAFSGAYTSEQLENWIRIFFKRFFSSQFKRSCAPDGPNIGYVSLSSGFGWSVPSDISGRGIMGFYNQ